MLTPHLVINYRAVAIILNGTFNLLTALWIYLDATRRSADKPWFAALAELLLGPLWLAFYLTDRPLCADERRSGGFGWSWMRNFAWAWSAFFVAALPICVRLGYVALGLAAWLVPIAVTLAIGFGIRRPSEAETGGPAPARAPVPLVGFVVLTAIANWLVLSALHRWIVLYRY
jgi:hypothetical protein